MKSMKIYKDNDNSFNRIVDRLDKPIRLITKERFTKIENATILVAGLSLLGGLLAFSLSKLKK